MPRAWQTSAMVTGSCLDDCSLMSWMECKTCLASASWASSEIGNLKKIKKNNNIKRGGAVVG